MKALQFEKSGILTRTYLQDCILELCRINGQMEAARVRLTVSRNETDKDRQADFLIESFQLEDHYPFYEKNLVTGIYPHARKSMDTFAQLKSCSYLPYAMAALYARQRQWDDCLVLNTANRICDASIANIFWIKREIIYTPPLSEGCIAGVMREYLIQHLPGAGFTIMQEPLELAALLAADEVFLTNAIRGIRPVGQLDQSLYEQFITEKLFKKLVQPLPAS